MFGRSEVSCSDGLMAKALMHQLELLVIVSLPSGFVFAFQKIVVSAWNCGMRM